LPKLPTRVTEISSFPQFWISPPLSRNCKILLLRGVPGSDFWHRSWGMCRSTLTCCFVKIAANLARFQLFLDDLFCSLVSAAKKEVGHQRSSKRRSWTWCWCHWCTPSTSWSSTPPCADLASSSLTSVMSIAWNGGTRGVCGNGTREVCFNGVDWNRSILTSKFLLPNVERSHSVLKKIRTKSLHSHGSPTKHYLR
jgi:hypothetical protein